MIWTPPPVYYTEIKIIGTNITTNDELDEFKDQIEFLFDTFSNTKRSIFLTNYNGYFSEYMVPVLELTYQSYFRIQPYIFDAVKVVLANNKIWIENLIHAKS